MNARCTTERMRRSRQRKLEADLLCRTQAPLIDIEWTRADSDDVNGAFRRDVNKVGA